MSSPFIIYALPRSRTAWLASYLSYGDYHCAHEQARHMRDLADVKAWLSMGFTGASETAAAPWWRLIQHYRPDIKTLVVRRPVRDAVGSWMRLDMGGICPAKRSIVSDLFEKLDHKLDQIVGRVPSALSVNFDDLNDESVCAAVFEHCLPYQHDHEWWAAMSAQNLQCDTRAMLRYSLAHKDRMSSAVLSCRKKAFALVRGKHRVFDDADGVVIQEEPFVKFWHDAQKLFAEHCVTVGESPDYFREFNLPLLEAMDANNAIQVVTARINGRMLGYLAAIIAPAIESKDLISATHTVFFASQDAQGLNLGVRLQRASIEAARAKGAGEVLMRAGVRGSGPDLGKLYQRLGAEKYGELYRVDLAA